MSIHLVRVHHSSPKAPAGSGVVYEFEVEETDALAAARRVVSQPRRGPFPAGVSIRPGSEGRDGAYVAADPARYDTVVDVDPKNLETMPRALAPSVVERLVGEVDALMDMDEQADFPTSVYHFLQAMAAHAERDGRDFSAFVEMAWTSAPGVAGREDLPAEMGYLCGAPVLLHSEVGEAIARSYEKATGRRDPDEDVVVADVLQSLTMLCERRGVDLVGVLQNVSEVRTQEMVARMTVDDHGPKVLTFLAP